MTKPNFKGNGNHSINELEKICSDFDLFCHEQQLIKQDLSTMLWHIHGMQNTVFGLKAFSPELMKADIKVVLDKSQL
jgi:hypothetical protein